MRHERPVDGQAATGLPDGADLRQAVPAPLIRALSEIAQETCLCAPVRFPSPILSDATQKFRAQNRRPKGWKLVRFYRLLLREAYPKAIDTEPKPEMTWLAGSGPLRLMGAETFLGGNRAYWSIENGTHPRLDCSVLEDCLRLHDWSAVEIYGFSHHGASTSFGNAGC